LCNFVALTGRNIISIAQCPAANKIAIMSINSEEAVEAGVRCCASCGIAPVDDIKLKICDGGCDLVKYCSDKCRENHREQHDDDCKKRKAELHDKELFEQPEKTCYGECPLCFLPMPIDQRKYTFYTCCCKVVCIGCDYADYLSNGGDRCPFCREPALDRDDEEEHDKRVMERVKANDPNALLEMGRRRYDEGDADKAFEYYTKAAELGDSIAHNFLGVIYCEGEDVEEDKEKGIHHYEKAAIGGHPTARHNLGMIEEDNGNIERAVKHFVIAANLGYKKSMKALWKNYSAGNITKEELDATLRAHQSAIDETKSQQRDAGEAYYRRMSVLP
jgi:tetratricopeptide (TPR) repeat protein